ncbi:MAG: helix-turn-helix transcriptional regulator [Lachnospiraceae bacterium]|nr:helix-turn-helix transcriptional regulator [Lachnospiraceae bacterium]
MGFYEDIERGLLEAIAMEKGEIPVVEKENMPAPTLVAADKEKKLIEELVRIRKEQNVSQSQLAKLTGSKQQAISRTENKEHSPSLKLFYCMANALGYDLQLVKM